MGNGRASERLEVRLDTPTTQERKQDIHEQLRGISLLQVMYKVLKRTQEQLENGIGKYQAGLGPRRLFAEQIFNLKTILRMRAIGNVPTVCTRKCTTQ